MGRERRKSVRELASEGDIDLDEALVGLWDAGFDDLTSPNDKIGPRDLNRARRALGLATRRELQSREYWMEVLDLSPEGLGDVVTELGLTRLPASGRLSRKAISRLRAHAVKVVTDPSTEDQSLAAEDYGGTNEVSFQWATIGHPGEPVFLSVEQVRAIHFSLVEEFAGSGDPIEPPGVRSEDLLASAVFRPHTSLGDVLKYDTLETSAAALLHSLVQDHAFHNGNKRTALVSFLVFLEENGLFLDCTQDQIFKLVLQVAQHRIAAGDRSNRDDREVLAIAAWLCERSRRVDKRERLIPWRRMRRILVAYDCNLETPGGVGNRINISRSRTVRGRFFGRKRERSLSTQVFYGDEGREVGIDVIKKIRSDLELDYENGADSEAFYGKEHVQVADTIARYRLTLRRLAKL